MEIDNRDMWRPIDEFYGLYEISVDGQIRSLDRRDSLGRLWRGRIMKHKHDKFGYVVIGLRKPNHKQTTHKVHRLVAMAFIDNLDKLPSINHKNGIKDDNRVENLEWTNASMNAQHAVDVLNRRSAIGEQHPNAKLTNSDILQIRHLYASGDYRQYQLADMFGVHQSRISYIINKRNWSHV